MKEDMRIVERVPPGLRRYARAVELSEKSATVELDSKCTNCRSPLSTARSSLAFTDRMAISGDHRTEAAFPRR